MFEFSEHQTNQLKARGISISDATAMIANINQRSAYCQIHRPATLGDGITEFSDRDLKHYVNFYVNVPHLHINLHANASSKVAETPIYYE